MINPSKDTETGNSERKNIREMIHKEVIKDELYVYINGKLAYKRWIKHGYGRLFQDKGHGQIISK